MPAASCPRCCSANRAKNAMLATFSFRRENTHHAALFLRVVPLRGKSGALVSCLQCAVIGEDFIRLGVLEGDHRPVDLLVLQRQDLSRQQRGVGRL